MTQEQYQESFNAMLKDISEMIEITGNEALKRLVKKRLFDFSNEIIGEGEGERANDRNQKQNR
jgi:hypothetical protein